MKIVYTDEAIRDLYEIASYAAVNYPTLGRAMDRRIRAVVARIARWPRSARRAARLPGVRVIPLGRYPYKIFYRVGDETIEILHIHHAAKQPWDEQS